MINKRLHSLGEIGRRKFIVISSQLAAMIFPAQLFASTDRKRYEPNTLIYTATGKISPDQMGITSCHEHLPVEGDESQRQQSMKYAIDELKKAKQLGIQTIVVVGPTEDVAAIREVSLATGVNIICCTGFYVLKDEQQSFEIKDFEDHMVKQIERGIQGTTIRPGVIKVATRKLPFTPAEVKLLTAAARVQRKYNLPMCIHSVTGCYEQQQILEENGADLKHCYFSHVEATFGWNGRTVQEEIDYLEKVVRKGSFLCFNNFGNWNHTKPEDLALIIKELTKRGYENNMVATMDVIWSFKEGALTLLWEDTNEDGRDRTYSYLMRKAVPWMKASNIAASVVDKLIIENPKRIFDR